MENTNTRSKFKIQNKGSHQIVDITLRAWFCELEDIEGKEVSKGVDQFEINNSNTRTLAPKGESDRPWGLTSEAEFSAVSDKNILEFLALPRTAILVTVKASDAISGTTVVKQRIYEKNHVTKGIFGYRDRMSVIESE